MGKYASVNFHPSVRGPVYFFCVEFVNGAVSSLACPALCKFASEVSVVVNVIVVLCQTCFL